MPVSSPPPLEPPYLTAEEIEAFAPYPCPRVPRDGGLKDRLEEAGCYGPGQIGGRRWPIGCVSLEVTQRCNLDCSLCYLSEHSEAVRDIPPRRIVSPKPWSFLRLFLGLLFTATGLPNSSTTAALPR